MDESNFVGCSEERDTWRILRERKAGLAYGRIFNEIQRRHKGNTNLRKIKCYN